MNMFKILIPALDQPSNVHVFDLGQDKITLTWQPSDGDVDEYEFRFTPNDDSPIITQPVRGDERVVTVTGNVLILLTKIYSSKYFKKGSLIL